MADKIVVVSQQCSKAIKIIKWKVSEGNSISIGCVLFIYKFEQDINSDSFKLKSTKAGTVHKILQQEGDVVNFGENLLELMPCIHPTVMKDMCAECGADLRKDNSEITANVPMIHSVPELKVSLELAQKLGKADNDRLLKDRKLVLLVDLDQTLIHTTNDNIPPNIKDVHHFQLYGPNSPWYHTRLRPGTHRFLEKMSNLYELHICTFGARNYAHMIAMFLDRDEKLFSHRILSRDECFNSNTKTANLKALFPCGDNMVCIIDDREDVWCYASNLIHVKPYHFFQHTGDINAPPGLDKHEDDDKEGVDLSKIKTQVNGTTEKNSKVLDEDEFWDGKNNLNKCESSKSERNPKEEKSPENEESPKKEEGTRNEESLKGEVNPNEESLKSEKGLKKEESSNNEESPKNEEISKIEEGSKNKEVSKTEEGLNNEVSPMMEDLSPKGQESPKNKENSKNEDQIIKIIDNRSSRNEVQSPKSNQESSVNENISTSPKSEDLSSKIDETEETQSPSIENSKTNKNQSCTNEDTSPKIKDKSSESPKIENSNSKSSKIDDTRQKINNTNPKVENSQNKTKSPKIETLNPKSEELSPKIEKPGPKNVKDPKIEESSSKIVELSPKNEDPSSMNEDSSPKFAEPNLKHKDSKSEVVTPINVAPSPKNEGPSPMNEDPCPKIEDPSPKSEDSKTEAKDPKKETLSPKNEETSPMNEDPSPKIEDSSPRNEDPSPKPVDSKTDSSDSKNETLSPKNQETSPMNEEASPMNEDASPKNDESNLKPNDLIEIDDPDDYLLYLEEILTIIHRAFYEKYDKMKSGEIPDLKEIIPKVRSNILKGLKLVFSGLVPTYEKLEQSKAYQVAKSLGAKVTQDLESDSTHLVAVRPGTAKVNLGRRKKTLKIVTPDWLWACAERWEHVDERLYPLNSKGSKNRHPPPHCSSPQHAPDFEKGDTRKRTASGRFMDTINPLMSFSSADIADMDREVEDIFNESESESENKKTQDTEVETEVERFKPMDTDSSSSSSDESLSNDHPHGWKPEEVKSRKRTRDDADFDLNETNDESTADEFPSTKFRRGEALSSDLDIGQDSNSEGSIEAPDEIDDGEWNMMGAALEREFLSNN